MTHEATPPNQHPDIERTAQYFFRPVDDDYTTMQRVEGPKAPDDRGRELLEAQITDIARIAIHAPGHVVGATLRLTRQAKLYYRDGSLLVGRVGSLEEADLLIEQDIASSVARRVGELEETGDHVLFAELLDNAAHLREDNERLSREARVRQARVGLARAELRGVLSSRVMRHVDGSLDRVSAPIDPSEQVPDVRVATPHPSSPNRVLDSLSRLPGLGFVGKLFTGENQQPPLDAEVVSGRSREAS